jgi:hypothetical protein
MPEKKPLSRADRCMAGIAGLDDLGPPLTHTQGIPAGEPVIRFDPPAAPKQD